MTKIAGLALLLVFLGGACQRADGPGSQPGLALVHIGSLAGAATIVAAFIAWLATERPAPADPTPPPHDQLSPKVFIVANDGHITIPVVGPYDTEPQAQADLNSVREQFDPHQRYAWAVATTYDDHCWTGCASWQR